MEFIDSHTHLYLKEFEEDRVAVVQRAIKRGIRKMLLPNIDKSFTESMLALCQAFPENCFPMMGLHPTSVKNDYEDQLSHVKAMLSSGKFVAIGEIGIDLYWDKTFFSQQCNAFALQIDLAREYSLPLVIHCRESFAEITTILREKQNTFIYSGVFHSFSGTPDQAMEAIALGFKLGINGVVTFKNSKLGAVIEEIGLEHFLLETDAPYLTPVPHRGKRNESSYLIYTAQKIADIKKITIQEVARVTTQTTTSLFKLN
jgi:TatD DNase family protein